MLQRILRAAQRLATTGQLAFPPSPIPFIRRKFGGKPCSFIQVGSNDGVDGDPIHDLIIANPQWHGLLIEPLPEPFARLVRSYKGRAGLKFAQVAVADETGTRPFYFIPREAGEGRDLPIRFDQMGSFNREHIVKHGAVLEPLIVETPVMCQPLRSLLISHCISKVDFIHIDTEGYDYEVLKQIDFEAWGTRLVLYESVHLSGSDSKRAEQLLLSHGFTIVNCGFDTLARRNNP
jgi:FkbM family methyltransferase